MIPLLAMERICTSARKLPSAFSAGEPRGGGRAPACRSATRLRDTRCRSRMKLAAIWTSQSDVTLALVDRAAASTRDQSPDENHVWTDTELEQLPDLAALQSAYFDAAIRRNQGDEGSYAPEALVRYIPC